MSDNTTAMGRLLASARTTTRSTFHRGFPRTRLPARHEVVLSSDGHAARFIILHGDHNHPRASSIDAIRTAAEESLKGTPLKTLLQITTWPARRPSSPDISEGAQWDLLIAISSLCLIYHHADHHTGLWYLRRRHCGTVALSLGASFGLSVLLCARLTIHLHWLVLAMWSSFCWRWDLTTICSWSPRFQTEIGAGLKTGIIRSMGGTGKVVGWYSPSPWRPWPSASAEFIRQVGHHHRSGFAVPTR